MSAPPAILCRNVWKIYGADALRLVSRMRNEGLGKDEVLARFGCVVGVADVSFEVGAGEIFCIMGLSGSGKSTLVRHINRLIEPTAGEIVVNGVDINRVSRDELRRLRAEQIGMVFQNMALFPHRSVIDNVAYGLEIRGVPRERRHAMAGEKLEMVGLAAWGGKYPDELSGGMQQRVGLARALAADPAILLMDEPFSALDPLIRRQLQGEFLKLAAIMNKTTIFITHDLDEAMRIGHRIAIMRDGRFVQVGTAEQIVTRPVDDYVADFVRDMPRLKLVRARSAMIPIDNYRRECGVAGLDGCATASLDADLDALIDLVLRTGRPVIVRDDRGRDAGVITGDRLLACIQGRHLESAPAGGANAENAK